MSDLITSVTLRGYTDDETLTIVQREEGIVLIHIDNTDELSPPVCSAPQVGATMSEVVEACKKIGWNTVGGPSVRPERVKEPISETGSTSGGEPSSGELHSVPVRATDRDKRSGRGRLHHTQDAFDADHIPTPYELLRMANDRNRR